MIRTLVCPLSRVSPEKRSNSASGHASILRPEKNAALLSCVIKNPKLAELIPVAFPDICLTHIGHYLTTYDSSCPGVWAAYEGCQCEINASDWLLKKPDMTGLKSRTATGANTGRCAVCIAGCKRWVKAAARHALPVDRGGWLEAAGAHRYAG